MATGTPCPVCKTHHLTGRYTQTLAGLTHRSRECYEVAWRANVNAGNVHAMADTLQAGKEALEGSASWCVRCGDLMVDATGDLCNRHVAAGPR